ncbi:hypothetical protein CEP52_014080 [Fusarium oligoseptatum]|uniref:HTH TFE/IIEalpha-type domain-containing protein n=1 Tax=Fusarium oligoseptatum TaxID=2604345 RepID=A0A428SQF0_9HYPO|nr:hypothetical protein CEP52_014080 [Fusarium oligoseptatum]
MDLAVTLIKSVMRAFYQTRDILVIDALILHEALRDDDLAYLMAINTKDLHKICGKLREDRFLTVHTRSELREGNPRPSNRTWYYINYRNTIDAIKWRVYTIDKEVQGTTQVASEKEGILLLILQSGVDSHGGLGQHRTSTGHEQSTRLNNQFKFISELLPKIDAVHIPECDFDRAFANARPVKRDATHQRAQTVAADAGANRPMAVKGLTNTGPQSIAVNISTSDGPTDAEKAAEQARKEKIAKQKRAAILDKEAAANSSLAAAPDTKATTQIDDIFEKLKAEQAAERAREEDEFGSEEEDEDEDEFEDVPPTGNVSSRDTPVTPAIKREATADGDNSDERQAKRVKVESKPVVKKEEEEDEDSEEELEFEDV